MTDRIRDLSFAEFARTVGFNLRGRPRMIPISRNARIDLPRRPDKSWWHRLVAKAALNVNEEPPQ